MRARETGRTRRAGRRCAASVRSRCGRPAAARRRLAPTHDSWSVVLVESWCVAQSWPSASRWRPALGNQQSGRSGIGRARARAGGRGEEREFRFVGKSTIRCTARAPMARAGLAMLHTLSCTSAFGDELQKIEVVCYSQTGTSRCLDSADSNCWPGSRHAVLSRAAACGQVSR
jgi:hypothetical protein